MKRQLLGMSMVAAMLLAASSAVAGGVNLAWTRCFGEGSGTANRAFACNTNTGTHTLVNSFILNADLVEVSGIELVMDFLSQASPLPEWWNMREATSCRPISLNATASANLADVVCVDWAQGQAVGGIGSYNTELGSIDGGLATQHRRLKAVFSVPVAARQNLVANTEYFSCNVNINSFKTVGSPACAGCSEPVCVVLNSINVATATAANNIFLGNASAAGSNIVTWQGVGPNCLLVPTRNTTWGAVKSLYR